MSSFSCQHSHRKHAFCYPKKKRVTVTQGGTMKRLLLYLFLSVVSSASAQESLAQQFAQVKARVNNLTDTPEDLFAYVKFSPFQKLINEHKRQLDETKRALKQLEPSSPQVPALRARQEVLMDEQDGILSEIEAEEDTWQRAMDCYRKSIATLAWRKKVFGSVNEIVALALQKDEEDMRPLMKEYDFANHPDQCDPPLSRVSRKYALNIQRAGTLLHEQVDNIPPPEGLREAMMPNLYGMETIFADGRLCGFIDQSASNKVQVEQLGKAAFFAYRLSLMYKRLPDGSRNEWQKEMVPSRLLDEIRYANRFVQAYKAPSSDESNEELRQLLGCDHESLMSFLRLLSGNYLHDHWVERMQKGVADLTDTSLAVRLRRVLLRNHPRFDSAITSYAQEEPYVCAREELDYVKKLLEQSPDDQKLTAFALELLSPESTRVSLGDKTVLGPVEKKEWLKRLPKKEVRAVREMLRAREIMARVPAYKRTTVQGLAVGGGATAAFGLAWAALGYRSLRKKRMLAQFLQFDVKKFSPQVVESALKKRIEAEPISAETFSKIQDEMKAVKRIDGLRKASGWLAALSGIGTAAFAVWRYDQQPEYQREVQEEGALQA